MKTSHRCSNSIPKPGQKPELPARIKEHETVVHHICTGIARELQRGGKVRTLAAHAARRWDGKAFKCDPTRKHALSTVTITRLFYQWRRGGELPAAVRLKYRPTSQPTIPAPVLERFAKFCATNQYPSLKSACTAFANRPGSFVRARQSDQRRPAFCYQTVRHYFSVAVFQAMQATHAAEATAKANRARLLAQSIADIRRRLPERLKRTRRTSAEVSRDSSTL